MNINILHMLDGAKQATGIAVIIDVFRAFSVEPYIINNNAKELLVTAEKELAYKYKLDNPDTILIGERHGIKLPGFDYGNSPTEIENIDFSNKTVLHTTSAGTQGIINATDAKEIITGSLVNAKAIAQYIENKNYNEVSLVCMGWEAKEQTDEDDLCAYYIKDLLNHTNNVDINKEIEKLKQTSGAKFFDKKQNTVFPEKDFYLSTKINKFDFVLKANKNDYGIYNITKIRV